MIGSDRGTHQLDGGRRHSAARLADELDRLPAVGPGHRDRPQQLPGDDGAGEVGRVRAQLDLDTFEQSGIPRPARRAGGFEQALDSLRRGRIVGPATGAG